MRALLDVVFPRSCVSCDAPGYSFLCPACLASVPWITTCCARCGAPSSRPIDGCADCRVLRPAFDAARAAAIYEGSARDALMAFKLGGERRAARHLARMMLDAAARLATPDVVTYVPGTRRAVAARGFDPARELAAPLARALAVPLAPLLVKIRETADQAGLSRRDRRRNLVGAFRAHAVAARSVLLVDDVLTTGSTADACARALRISGIQRIEVLTFARAR